MFPESCGIVDVNFSVHLGTCSFLLKVMFQRSTVQFFFYFADVMLSLSLLVFGPLFEVRLEFACAFSLEV